MITELMNVYIMTSKIRYFDHHLNELRIMKMLELIYAGSRQLSSTNFST